MGYDPVSLDLIATSDNGSIWTQLLIYDTLVPDATGTKLEPGLAESWTVSDDGLTIRFQAARREILRRHAGDRRGRAVLDRARGLGGEWAGAGSIARSRGSRSRTRGRS